MHWSRRPGKTPYKLANNLWDFSAFIYSFLPSAHEQKLGYRCQFFSSSASVFVLVTDSRASCLHFIRLFWNHTLTWLSDNPSMEASWCLSALVKYFCTWKRFSSPLRCKFENTARVQGLLGLRGLVCPWIDWLSCSEEDDGWLFPHSAKRTQLYCCSFFCSGLGSKAFRNIISKNIFPTVKSALLLLFDISTLI